MSCAGEVTELCWKLQEIVFSINSLNLSGPACGLDCSASADIPVADHQQSSEVNNAEYDLTEHLSELCETLCDNGLGV